MSEKELNDLIHTGELAKQEIFEKSAEAAAAVDEGSAEEIKAENEKRKRTLIKFGLMTVLAAIILVFASIAWFTMNRETSTSGMNIQVGAPPFELAAKGNQIKNLSIFPLADSEYSFGTSGTDPDDDTTYYRTGSETEQIYLRFTGTDDDADAELEPGGSGVFEFYVIPNQDKQDKESACSASLQGG